MKKNTLTPEQRLEQWARKYFVPVAQRFPNWHPTILEEIALKDFAELRRTAPPTATVAATSDINGMTEMPIERPQDHFVPLTPMQSGYRRDQPQNVIARPKFKQTPAEQPCPSELFLG